MHPTASAPVHTAATVCQLLGIVQTPDEPIAALGPPPDPRAGFVTFFDPGASILVLRDALKGKRVFYPQDWYDRESFASAEDSPRYRQVRLGPVPGSPRKTYAEQLTVLPEGEEVPTARIVVAAVVTHFLATDVRLLPSVYVRCADQTARGARVHVGGFDAYGLLVNDYWYDNRIANVGLASARKF